MILFFVLLGLIVLDGWTTLEIMKSGYGIEHNPILRIFFRRFGLFAGLVLSRALAAFGAVMLLVFAPAWFLVAADLIYGCIVASNLWQLGAWHLGKG